MVRIGSLCSGYGGLDLGLISALGGAQVVWHAEYDDAPSQILTHHWPDVPNLRDITAIDWTQVEPVDWLTAGYPCQPFSLAGKRKGAADERHLWPHIADAIGVLRPGHVLLENVAGPYGPAITCWEHATGRPAPRPTEPGRHGKPRLSPAFVEWLMGLPAGHVTDVPVLTRNQQLKALGNGVVPQQAALALALLTRDTSEVAA